MPRRLGRKLMLSITVIVIIVAAVSGLVNIKTEEQQLLDTMAIGADQLSKGITAATWQFMLDDHREAAYEVMKTIALKQGIDRIRMFNRAGQVTFSTRPDDPQPATPLQGDVSHRVRVRRDADGGRRLEMITPIPNEPSCSQAACHAHPAGDRVLGVLDVQLGLDRVDDEVSSMKYRVLLVTGVEITLIGLFIIYFTRRFLSRPIEKLIEGAKSVSQMELDKPVEIDNSSEEIQDLGNSFEVMRTRLQAALGEINQFTQNLEIKVEERTKQLQAAQKKLLHTDRLASLGTLSASVAHEINNPISGVLNLSMLLQRMLKPDGVPPERLEEFRKYLGQVTNETARVGRIVSDLLAFSRRSKPQRAPADLNRVVKSTLSLVQHKLKLSNVAVETNLAEDLPAAPCDASQIQQVVLNLVLNGAEATQSKADRRIVVETSTADNNVILTVSDNGEGIAPENVAKIFDPFFTTKPDGKGVGLGLAVSYGIIQAHGGDIEVKSHPGVGTTFTVSLPIEQAAPIPEPAPLSPATPREALAPALETAAAPEAQGRPARGARKE